MGSVICPPPGDENPASAWHFQGKHSENREEVLLDVSGPLFLFGGRAGKAPARKTGLANGCRRRWGIAVVWIGVIFLRCCT